MQKYESLKSKSNDELIAYYNDLGRQKSATQEIIILELHQRQADAMNRRMEAMARQMRDMTIVILVLTVVNVAAILCQMFCMAPIK